MTGRSKDTQLPMTEVNYLSTTENPNQETQLEFIGQMKFKRGQVSILCSIN